MGALLAIYLALLSNCKSSEVLKAMYNSYGQYGDILLHPTFMHVFEALEVGPIPTNKCEAMNHSCSPSDG